MNSLLQIVFLISVLLLQGCVAAAMVSTAVVSTKLATDPRTIGTQIDDSILKLRINSALSKDEQIKKKARISIAVYQNKVLLAGQAPYTNMILRAKQIVMNITGVTEIFNEIRQGQPINLGTISLDTWITAKIRSQLLSSSQVKSSNIKIMTENGEVFLLGLVTEHEGRLAANIASWVNGVKQVTTAFTYIK